MSETFDYPEARHDADELIAEFGQTGAIRRTAAGAGDPWNPQPGTTTDHPCTLVELEFEAREIDGTLVRQTDRKVLVAAGGLAIEPSESDQVIAGGHAMEIVNVKPLAPAGVVVLFEIQARG